MAGQSDKAWSRLLSTTKGLLTAASLLGDELVTAELPQPLPAGVADVLTQFGIPVPPDGQLAVRITAGTAPR